MSSPLGFDGYGLLPVVDVPKEYFANFSCGKPHLDAFLVERAEFFHKERLGHTWIVVHSDCDAAVAYFSLNNDSLELNSSEEADLGLTDEASLKRFPAVNIGRLAVDSKYHNTGVSDQVIRLALDQILGDSEVPSAARLVVVDADNDEKVIRYYERNGFVRSLWAEKQALHQGGKRLRPSIKMLRDILLPW